MEINTQSIKRHGKTILLGNGLTATEGRDGGMPKLTIRQDGKVIRKYRGGSLYFGRCLSAEDKKYLKSLAEG